MMLKDDVPRIKERLRQIPDVTVTTQWPKEEPTEPVILLILTGDNAADHRDDVEYLTELEYTLHVFAPKEAQMRELCGAVHEAMEELGYARTFRYEDVGTGWRQTIFRYTTYI